MNRMDSGWFVVVGNVTFCIGAIVGFILAANGHGKLAFAAVLGFPMMSLFLMAIVVFAIDDIKTWKNKS